jgi:hypothetical protein
VEIFESKGAPLVSTTLVACSSGFVDTSGKFATGVNDTSDKFADGVNDTSGK